MSKILFLDIDGVLNSESWFTLLFEQRGQGPTTMNEHEALDPKAIAALNEITDATGARIVLSSTWRLVSDFPARVKGLHAQGIKAPIIGRTPSLMDPNVRGHEIAAWLMTQVEWPEGIAILDDDTDMAHLMPWLVRTGYDTGLVHAQIPTVVDMLNRPGWNSESRNGPRNVGTIFSREAS